MLNKKNIRAMHTRNKCCVTKQVSPTCILYPNHPTSNPKIPDGVVYTV